MMLLYAGCERRFGVLIDRAAHLSWLKISSTLIQKPVSKCRTVWGERAGLQSMGDLLLKTAQIKKIGYRRKFLPTPSGGSRCAGSSSRSSRAYSGKIATAFGNRPRSALYVQLGKSVASKCRLGVRRRLHKNKVERRCSWLAQLSTRELSPFFLTS